MGIANTTPKRGSVQFAGENREKQPVRKSKRMSTLRSSILHTIKDGDADGEKNLDDAVVGEAIRQGSKDSREGSREIRQGSKESSDGENSKYRHGRPKRASTLQQLVS